MVVVMSVVMIMPVIVKSTAMSVTHSVSMEIVEVVMLPVFSVMRIRTVIAVAWIVMVVYISMKVTGTMEPSACTDEDAVVEPLRAVIAIRRATVGSIIVIAVGADRRAPELNRDLCRTRLYTGCREDSRSRKYKEFLQTHPMLSFAPNGGSSSKRFESTERL